MKALLASCLVYDIMSAAGIFVGALKAQRRLCWAPSDSVNSEPF